MSINFIDFGHGLRHGVYKMVLRINDKQVGDTMICKISRDDDTYKSIKHEFELYSKMSKVSNAFNAFTHYSETLDYKGKDIDVLFNDTYIGVELNGLKLDSTELTEHFCMIYGKFDRDKITFHDYVKRRISKEQSLTIYHDITAVLDELYIKHKFTHGDSKINNYLVYVVTQEISLIDLDFSIKSDEPTMVVNHKTPSLNLYTCALDFCIITRDYAHLHDAFTLACGLKTGTCDGFSIMHIYELVRTLYIDGDIPLNKTFIMFYIILVKLTNCSWEKMMYPSGHMNEGTINATFSRVEQVVKFTLKHTNKIITDVEQEMIEIIDTMHKENTRQKVKERQELVRQKNKEERDLVRQRIEQERKLAIQEFIKSKSSSPIPILHSRHQISEQKLDETEQINRNVISIILNKIITSIEIEEASADKNSKQPALKEENNMKLDNICQTPIFNKPISGFIRRMITMMSFPSNIKPIPLKRSISDLEEIE
jgi:hypothetical protein